MRIVGTLFITIGILFGLFGVWTFWREHGYEAARIVTKGTVSSVKIERVRDGLSNILYTLTFQRDGSTDTIDHKITEQWTFKDPLPSLEQLKLQTFYIHYVPKEKRSKTVYPMRTMVLDTEIYPRFYYPTAFGQMTTFILLGFIVRIFFPKKRR